MKQAFVSSNPPGLSEREREWCLQFTHALQLQEILYLSPVATEIQEEIGWIDHHLKNNRLQQAESPSKTSCEAIWVLGIGDGLWFDRAFEWLEGSTDRFLLIIETKVAHLRAFLRSDRSKDRWNHPKIALLLLDPKYEITGESTLKLAYQLLNDTKAMGLSHPSYSHSTSQTIVWNMLRGLIYDFQEVKQAHLPTSQTPDLMAHALKNTIHIPMSKFHDHLGHWMDMPVILCGAGPSLNESLEDLRSMQGRALIISCGTASQILMHAKIEPDWIAGVCPYFLHYDRFRRIDYIETPAMTGLVAHPGVMRAMSGCKVLLKGLSRLGQVPFLEKTYGFIAANESDYGQSVLTSTLKGCVDMGCTKIVLLGVDLCYAGERKYALGADQVHVKRSKEESSADYSMEINLDGEPVVSHPIWLQERAWLENFLKANPQVDLIQGSKSSLPIQGASSYQVWESMLKQPTADSLWVERDLAAVSWQAYQNAPENPKVNQASFLEKIKDRLAAVQAFAFDSLQQVQLLTKQMDLSGPQRLLTIYREHLQKEPLLRDFLLKIDDCIATVQVRQFWLMSRDIKMKPIHIQKLKRISLLAERLQVMRWRLSQLQEAIDDVLREHSWKK